MTVNPISPFATDEDLLVAFANLGHDRADELDDVPALRSWAVSVGLPVPEAEEPAEDLELLRSIRRTVQDLLLAHNGVPVQADLRPLETLPVRLAFGDEIGLRAANRSTTTQVVAGEIASALLRSAARPGWTRLKACPGPGCAYVFRDQSRNASRRWCLMSECGNRAKGAAFRSRAGRAD